MVGWEELNVFYLLLFARNPLCGAVQEGRKTAAKEEKDVTMKLTAMFYKPETQCKRNMLKRMCMCQVRCDAEDDAEGDAKVN